MKLTRCFSFGVKKKLTHWHLLCNPSNVHLTTLSGYRYRSSPRQDRRYFGVDALLVRLPNLALCGYCFCGLQWKRLGKGHDEGDLLFCFDHVGVWSR